MKPQDRTRAILRSKAEPSMRLLLIALADHMGTRDGEDVCWVAPPTLAEETGLALSTVDGLLKAAAAAGLIRRWMGDHRSKDTVICWDELATHTPKGNARGGRRPPIIGGEAPNIGGGVPPDNRGDAPRLSVACPPITGELPPDYRGRSDHEATMKRLEKRPLSAPAAACEPPGERTNAGNPQTPDSLHDNNAASNANNQEERPCSTTDSATLSSASSSRPSGITDPLGHPTPSPGSPPSSGPPSLFPTMPGAGPGQADGSPSRASGPRLPSATTPAAPAGTRPPDLHALYGVWRAHHGRAPPTPTKDGAKALGRILDECGGLDRAGLYLAWVHQSEDRHARQLRGAEPWQDGDIVARHDLVSLARNIGPRMAQAEAWEARRRLPQERGQPPPGRDHRGKTAIELYEEQMGHVPTARPDTIDVHFTEVT